jgi:hypothetical protein
MLQAIVHSTSLIFLSICSGHSRRATKKIQYRVVILARVLIVDDAFSRLFFSFPPPVNNCLQQENPLTNMFLPVLLLTISGCYHSGFNFKGTI